MILGQRHPGLDAMQSGAGFARGLGRALGMDDAVAGRHPVDVTRPDHLLAAEAVAVHDLALEQIGDRGQPDMRMRTHIGALPGRHRHRAHVIEEDERADGLSRGGRQQAAHGEIAQVPHMGLEQVFDGRHKSSGFVGKAFLRQWRCSRQHCQCSGWRNTVSRHAVRTEARGKPLTHSIRNADMQCKFLDENEDYRNIDDNHQELSNVKDSN